MPLTTLRQLLRATVRGLAPVGVTPLPLPGRLDPASVLSSRFPEIVTKPGIAVSMLQPDTMIGASLPGAVLMETFVRQGVTTLARPSTGLTFQGTFGVFSRHVNGAGRMLYQNLVVANESDRPVVVQLGRSHVRAGLAAVTLKLPAIMDPALKLAFGTRGDAQAAESPGRGEHIATGTTVVVPPRSRRVVDRRRLPPWHAVAGGWRLTSDGPVRLAVVFTSSPEDGAVETVLAAGASAANPGEKRPVRAVQSHATWLGRLAEAGGGPFGVHARFERAWRLDVARDPVLYDLEASFENAGARTRQLAVFVEAPGRTGPVEVAWTDEKGVQRRVYGQGGPAVEGARPLVVVPLAGRHVTRVQLRLGLEPGTAAPEVLRVSVL